MKIQWLSAFLVECCICSSFAQQCTQGDIRLQGGSDTSNGRVEICNNNIWGTVCDDLWSSRDAQVVCRQLGLSSNGAVATTSGFTNGAGEIWLDNVACVGTESRLIDCPANPLGDHDCNHIEDAGVLCVTISCTQGDIRLQGGTATSGRVEICNNNIWGTVCDDFWGGQDAQVVCNQLGLATSGAVATTSGFTNGVGQIWLDNVACDGSETRLIDCPASPLGSHNCGHSEDAGVICISCTQGDIRLQGGTATSGRVEICNNNIWGTVCDDSWDTQDARVACEQLGLPSDDAVLNSTDVLDGTGQIWLDDVECVGNERRLIDCPANPLGNHNCNHVKDAGVQCEERGITTCTQGDIRLQGGTATRGRVEICNNNIWGTVCDDSWGIEDAQIACRQLGLPSDDAVVLTLGNVPDGTGGIWLDQVSCDGTESRLIDCPANPLGDHDCTHLEDAGVQCEERVSCTYGDIRLQGGTATSGRVEICNDNIWGTVCDDFWGTQDAQVACRQLGLSSDNAVVLVLNDVPDGFGQIWLDNVQCAGSETRLIDCPANQPGNHNCNHFEDAGVRCEETIIVTCTQGDIRLQGGTATSGRVEICNNNIWGTVCDDSWGDEDARIACSQLGLATSGAVAIFSGFTDGVGPIWLDEVSCVGTETRLIDCPANPLGLADCSHNEDAGVLCTTEVACSPMRCFNGGTCTPPSTCSCPAGWTGSRCETDVVECFTDNGGCEHTCNNTLGSFTCSCRNGYELDTDDQGCHDIDECETNNDTCSDICMNTEGSFVCSCSPGFEFGSGGMEDICEDVDDCALANGNCDHTCTNTIGSRMCSCDDGYMLESDNESCSDINECVELLHDCVGVAECMNSLGSYHCTCSSGYTLTPDQASCSDVDECVAGITGCAHICNNTIGSYECLCEEGYELDSNGFTCSDLDECDLNVDNCQELCVNTEGSFECACSRGFSLDSDGVSCNALQCLELQAPLNGQIEDCDTETGQRCVFSCDTGYTLSGSTTRICLPTSTWSGRSPVCEPMLCEPLEPPENGIILPPCEVEFSSNCTILCGFGYELEGPGTQTCSLGANGPEWSEAPICTESGSLCDTSPCENNGVCLAETVMDPTFQCNCSGTGYKGPTCNIGIVTTPTIPTLVVNQTSSFDVRATPTLNIVVEVMADPKLMIKPKRIVLNGKETSGTFKVTGNQTGKYTLRYKLFGPEAPDFEVPDSSPILVSEDRSEDRVNRYFRYQRVNPGLLIESCCEATALVYSECPMSTSSIKFRSSCSWASRNSQHETSGIVFAQYSSLILPVSISGINIGYADNTISSSLSQVPVSSCTECVTNRGAFLTSIIPLKSPNCYFYHFDAGDVEDMLKSNSLANTFMDRLTQLLPPWFVATIPTNETDLSSFKDTDFAVTLVEQEDVAGVGGCESVQADDPGLYIVLRYGRAFMVSVDQGSVQYVPSSATGGSPVCVAVNLCKDVESPVYLGLPVDVQPIVRQLPALALYSHENWQYSIESAVLYSKRQEVATVMDMYWNGTELYSPEFPNADFRVTTTITASFESVQNGYISISVDFKGDILTYFPEEKSRSALLNGDSSLHMELIIGRTSNSLTLDSSTPAVFYTNDNVSLCNQGLSLLTTYTPRANQEFFSTLFTLEDVTPQCQMDVFVNLDSSLVFHGASISLSHGCPNLMLDRLLFSSMEHMVYLHESDSPLSECSQTQNMELTVQDPIMIIHSSLSNSVPLGRFIILNQEPNTPAMITAYSAQHVGYRTRLNSVVVSILGTTINCSMEIEDGMLSLETSAQLYDSYDASLQVTAPTDTPWERSALMVEGEFQENTTNAEIEEFVYNYIDDDVIGRARLRIENAEMAVGRAEELVGMLEAEYTTRDENFNQANESYIEALEMLEFAEESLEIAEGAFENSSKELEEAEMALDSVCSENDCEDIELTEQQVCTTRYVPSYSNVSSVCVRLAFRQREVLTRILPDRVYRSWQYVTCCFTYCEYSCYAFSRRSCYTVCRGVCKSVTRSEPQYAAATVSVLEEEMYTCPSQSLVGQTPEEVCETSSDPVLVENTDCKDQCRVSRQAAVQGLQQSRQDLAAPFQALEDARALYATARSDAVMELLRRDTTMELRDQLIPLIDSAKTSLELNKENQIAIMEELEQELKLAKQVEQGGDILNITKASFNITIDTTSPTAVPVDIVYESLPLQLTRKVEVNFDFNSQRQMNLRRIAEAIVKDLLDPVSRGSTERMRRQVSNEDRSVNQVEFETNCADLSALEDFVEQLRGSMFSVRETQREVKERLEESIAELRERLEIKNRPKLDLETLRDFFNVSLDDISSLPEQGSSAYTEYLQELIKIATATIEAMESSSFTTWQTSTDVLYNELDSIVGYPCNGFTDCLDVVLDTVEKLVDDLPTTSADKAQLTENLQQSSDDFITLATLMNLTLPDAIDIASDLLLLLKADTLRSYWCSSLPNITEYPPIRVNVSVGGDLVLMCTATSSLPYTVHWRKNRVPIPNTDKLTFTLPSVQMSDGGNYTCVVSNAVGSSESLVTNVTVYELPEFFSVLSPVTTMVGNDTEASFACNASGFPYPGWRWYFTLRLSEEWIEIPDEDTNELTISSPQFWNQGWYTCEAYNYFGSKRAEPGYLTILPRSVSQLSFAVSLNFSVNDDAVLGSGEEGSGEGERSSVDPQCSISEFHSILSVFLFSSEIDLRGAIMDSLDITYDSQFSVSFAIVSENVTNNRIDRLGFEDVQNQALPSRGDVIHIRESLQNVFSQDGVSFMCNGHQLASVENSLNFDLLTYRCPDGQELSSDFLFCVSCSSGRYQTMIEAVRVFDGEGYRERYPTCQACPVSTYSDEVGSSSCRRCPAHHQTRSTGSASVGDCYVDPLLLECSTEGSGNEVTINCQTNRPVITSLCSFDGGLDHSCAYPIVINTRNNFPPGPHVISFSVRDNLGFEAETSVNYDLSEDAVASNVSSMVPQLGVHFVNRTPRVTLGQMEAEFILTRPVATITCQLQGVNSEINCSSGRVVYSDLSPGRYTLRIAAINYKKEDRAIVRRKFEVPPADNVCLVHLVNDGLVVEETTGNVTIDFGGVGPVYSFVCFLDGGTAKLCTPPVMYSGLAKGPHSVVVDPQGCQRNRRRARYKFTL